MAGKTVFTKYLEALILTIAVVAVLLFVTWQLASRPVTPEAEALHKNVAFLASEADRLKNRLRDMQSRQTVLEHEADVLRQANRLLKEEEAARQSELIRLRSELDFYRRLAGTGGAQQGLDVYRAELTPTESPLVFRFELTLTQNIRRAAVITGRVNLDVEGISSDRPITLRWDRLSAAGSPEPSFRFKYFQQLEGYLTLPAEFSPTRLVISLEASGRAEPMQRRYDWEDLLNPAAEAPRAGDSSG
ncbi:MAG: hypothetical protein HKP16_05965 [Xanthomonadales bacterium]|nr:hypothetical protein [Xanthomonadales bacterium]